MKDGLVGDALGGGSGFGFDYLRPYYKWAEQANVEVRKFLEKFMSNSNAVKLLQTRNLLIATTAFGVLAALAWYVFKPSGAKQMQKKLVELESYLIKIGMQANINNSRSVVNTTTRKGDANLVNLKVLVGAIRLYEVPNIKFYEEGYVRHNVEPALIELYTALDNLERDPKLECVEHVIESTKSLYDIYLSLGLYDIESALRALLGKRKYDNIGDIERVLNGLHTLITNSSIESGEKRELLGILKSMQTKLDVDGILQLGKAVGNLVNNNSTLSGDERQKLFAMSNSLHGILGLEEPEQVVSIEREQHSFTGILEGEDFSETSSRHGQQLSFDEAPIGDSRQRVIVFPRTAGSWGSSSANQLPVRGAQVPQDGDSFPATSSRHGQQLSFDEAPIGDSRQVPFVSSQAGNWGSFSANQLPGGGAQVHQDGDAFPLPSSWHGPHTFRGFRAVGGPRVPFVSSQAGNWGSFSANQLPGGGAQVNQDNASVSSLGDDLGNGRKAHRE
jgi:hypothetical protein